MDSRRNKKLLGIALMGAMALSQQALPQIEEPKRGSGIDVHPYTRPTKGRTKKQKSIRRMQRKSKRANRIHRKGK